MNSSMLYTIGTALNRARESDFVVEILVEGTWLSGRILAVDGFGVCLQSGDDVHSVIRVESISAVTVRAAAPHQMSLENGTTEAHAMPGPRLSAE